MLVDVEPCGDDGTRLAAEAICAVEEEVEEFERARQREIAA
jgi:hypothetical protein